MWLLENSTLKLERQRVSAEVQDLLQFKRYGLLVHIELRGQLLLVVTNLNICLSNFCSQSVEHNVTGGFQHFDLNRFEAICNQSLEVGLQMDQVTPRDDILREFARGGKKVEFVLGMRGGCGKAD